MKWKLFYNLVAITTLATSYAQIDGINKSSEGIPYPRPILHTPGQHLPSPAELLQGYKPRKEIDITKTVEPTTVKTTNSVQDNNIIVSIDKDKSDILNSERQKLLPFQISNENVSTATANTNRSSRYFELESKTPSSQATSNPVSLVKCSDTISASNSVSQQSTNTHSDFIKTPSPPAPSANSSKPSVSLLPRQSLLLSESSTQPVLLPSQHKDLQITNTSFSVESSINPSIRSSTQLESNNRETFRRPPQPHYYLASNQNPTLYHTTPSIPSSTLTPKLFSSPSLQETSELTRKSPPARLPLWSASSSLSSSSTVTSKILPPTLNSFSDEIKITPKLTARNLSLPTSKVSPSLSSSTLPPNNIDNIPSPTPRLSPPRLPLTSNLNLNQNKGFNTVNSPSVLREPIKNLNIAFSSLGSQASNSKFPSLSGDKIDSSLNYYSSNISQDISMSQKSSNLSIHSPPLAPSIKSSTLQIPSVITTEKSKPITLSSLSINADPLTTSAPNITPQPQLSYQVQPLHITVKINTGKPNVTLIYPDQSIPNNSNSIKINPNNHILNIPETNLPKTSPSTVAPICVQRYAYLKMEGSSDSYFECQEYQPTHKRCEEGLYYNPKLEWPKYPCDSNEVKIGEITTEHGPIPSPNGIEKYRMVINGHYYEMNCPQGLIFNPMNARCDWPSLVSCNSDVSLSFKCPLEGIDESGNPTVANYKYEGSCTLFYSCQAGYARVLSCRPGFAFNTISSRCEKAELVTCDNYTITT